MQFNGRSLSTKRRLVGTKQRLTWGTWRGVERALGFGKSMGVLGIIRPRMPVVEDSLVLAELDDAGLDVKLQRQTAFPIGCLLTRRGIPFMSLNGLCRGALPVEFGGVSYLGKPFEPESLQQRSSERAQRWT